MRPLLAALVIGSALVDADALADAQDAGDGQQVRGCVETLAAGATRPVVVDTMPPRGLSGYASTLVVRVQHGKGERVLPSGLDLQRSSDTAKLLQSEGWVLPDQDGGGAARLESKPSGAGIETTLELPLLALPDSPGRKVLHVPALPVAVARASGEISVVCTHPHAVTVEDPIASVDRPEPKPNPAPLPQREEWTALKNGLAALAMGVLLGALAVWLVRRWSKRPRPLPPPPPPRPPWEVALERLHEVRHSGLVEAGRGGEWVDRVSDAVRAYLGARYGFDGLESTTDEILGALRGVSTGAVSHPEIASFLQSSDLVKFANHTPSAEECMTVLDAGEKIVRATIPAPTRTAAERAS